MSKQLFKIAAVSLAALASACSPNPTPKPPQPAMENPRLMVQRGSAAMYAVSAAAAAQAPLQLEVDLYQLQIPLGTVSRNEKFWKRVDEQCVDVATYDLLFKNGVRVGEAPIAEWDYFRQVMEGHPAVTKANTLVGAQGKPIELPLRKEARGQDIWYFDSTNALIGRTYDDQCENVISMTMQSAPRQLDTLRIVLCPMVRSMRKRLSYSVLNSELGEISYVTPERIYDLNLRVDVPLERFLIVAPSSDSVRSTSIGGSFFLTDGPAERMETVLLIVPRPLRQVEPLIKSH